MPTTRELKGEGPYRKPTLVSPFHPVPPSPLSLRGRDPGGASRPGLQPFLATELVVGVCSVFGGKVERLGRLGRLANSDEVVTEGRKWKLVTPVQIGAGEQHTDPVEDVEISASASKDEKY